MKLKVSNINFEKMSEKAKEPASNEVKETVRKAQPGDGLRSLRSSYAFRAINFELYAKPSKKMVILRVTFKESA